jgi:hypothetical protein
VSDTDRYATDSKIFFSWKERVGLTKCILKQNTLNMDILKVQIVSKVRRKIYSYSGKRREH